jgi:tRNA A-37 threonylcarbamoyl transferase component Bud32
MPAPTAPERHVADRYVLKAPIGRGGMGVVWRAHDTVLGREVAMKQVVPPATLPPAERRAAQARVMREARAAARLNHPGAVTLYDVVQDGGETFIVMELVGAPTLADLVRREGPLAPERIAEIGAQVASALEAAHRAGIVHRDVKPGNVMVPASGSAKLADFGVASLQGDPRLTSTGLVVGSPAYMAPEQARGEPSGPPADFWALGATMYYAVEGEPPFDRGGSIQTLGAVVSDPPRPMERAGPLAPVLADLLDKDPGARPTGPELRERLARAADPAATGGTRLLPPGEDELSTTATLPAQAPVAMPAPVGEHPPVGEGPPVPPPVGERPLVGVGVGAGRGRRRGALWLAGLAVLLAAGLLVAALAGLFGADRRGGGASATTRRAPAAGTATSAGRAPTTTAAPTTATTAGQAGLPAGWTAFSDRAGAYTLGVPPGWRPNTGGGSNTTRIEEPGGARTFIVQSKRPPNPLPQASRDYRAFAERNFDGYREVRFDEHASYAGRPAVVFEFLARENGREVHVSHVNFVAGRWGYNVRFTTPAEQWDGSQGLAGQFERAFRPTG